jgi:hypothetical protein
MSDRQRYPSGVTDEQWALIGPFLIRPESSVSRPLWASMVTMVRRLTGTSTQTWRPR